MRLPGIKVVDMHTQKQKKKKKKKMGVYSTRYSRVVTLPSTDRASTCLDSVSGTGTVAFRCVWP